MTEQNAPPVKLRSLVMILALASGGVDPPYEYPTSIAPRFPRSNNKGVPLVHGWTDSVLPTALSSELSEVPFLHSPHRDTHPCHLPCPSSQGTLLLILNSPGTLFLLVNSPGTLRQVRVSEGRDADVRVLTVRVPYKT